MDSKSFEKLKNMPPEEIMKVGEVKLVKPAASKRANEEEFAFTFEISAFTDPDWRDIFEKHYGSKKVQFHGSQLTLTCKPTDLESEVPKVKLIMMSTNQDYLARRERLLSEIAAKNETERTAAVNRNLEESEVDAMFQSFKV